MNRPLRSRIVGTGMFVPEQVVTNDDLAKLMGLELPPLAMGEIGRSGLGVIRQLDPLQRRHRAFFERPIRHY